MTGGGSSSSSPPPTNPRHNNNNNNTPNSSRNGPAAAPSPRQPFPRQQRQDTTPPLLLTVRFSTSIPDLLLDIPHPHRTTAAALKHLIRSRLDQPNSQRRIRFIHGGKIIPDNAVLASVLKALPPPPTPSTPPSADGQDHRGDGNGKGKGKGKGKGVEGQQAAQRVYVNCSIGDLLTDAELDEEGRRAEEPPPEENTRHPSPTTTTNSNTTTASAAAASLSSPFRYQASPSGNNHNNNDDAAAAAPAPRGFDRLLSAGFTPAEVNQLRLQFRSIQEARHTADTMPSPDGLRGMEDAWIDSNHTGGGAAFGNSAGPGGGSGGGGGGEGDDEGNGGGGGGDGGVAGDEGGLAGVLDILLRGMFIGFIWPLGAVGWLVRDEEKISKRTRVFVYFGFVLSLLVGTIRTIG
ncbi:hypothetical protein SLS53_007628 [Cytospora paraplurivora]|uniref:Ubiquitin-like domain-containing protein n=1 Tax=Cytospora paraplurivora TaxID=2898453 RepID=A0AAN9U0T6_9PEZI